MKPFVKWAGGKRQILDRIMRYIDGSTEEGENYYRYVEPFLGGGAVFFHLKPKKAIINDLNSDLINAYEVIKSDQYTELINLLKEHEQAYREDAEEHYYDVRHWDREEGWPNNHNDVERAARMIFLNRTCYNGLYRVNSKGEFNTPLGRYLNPTICDETNIKEVHDFLNENEITIRNQSYEEVLIDCGDKDLIYIDPPYDYKDDDGFTKYQMSGFSFDDFRKLKDCCDKAIDKGACVVISNNATEKVLDLFIQDRNYTAYYPDTFRTLRNINCKGSERRTGNEVIIVGVSFKIVPQANDMNKIIKLASAGEDILENKEKAKEVLGVTTDRQVAYYLSALKFFDYIISSNKFSDKFLEMHFDEKLISKDIYMKLRENRDIKKFIGTNSSIKDISKYLQSNYEDLADATAERRASTIYRWIQWMNEYEKKSDEL